MYRFIPVQQTNLPCRKQRKALPPGYPAPQKQSQTNRKNRFSNPALSMVRPVVMPENAKKENPPNLNGLAGFATSE